MRRPDSLTYTDQCPSASCKDMVAGSWPRVSWLGKQSFRVSVAGLHNVNLCRVCSISQLLQKISHYVL